MESERRWSPGGGTYTGDILGAISAKGLIIPLSGLRVKIQGLSNPNHKKFYPKVARQWYKERERKFCGKALRLRMGGLWTRWVGFDDLLCEIALG